MDWNTPKMPKGIVRKIKCWLGYHAWKDTGIRRMYGFVGCFECVHCGVQREFCEEGISFETIAGVECMRIQRRD